MHRIDDPAAVTSLPQPAQQGTPGFFTGGNPASGQAATVVSADYMNAVQEEICYVIEAAGIVLSKVDRTQLYQALQRLTRIRLYQDFAWYIGPSGNDVNDGLTPATAWGSIRHGYEYIRDRIDPNGHQTYLQLLDGWYAGADLEYPVIGPPPIINGNGNDPTKVRILGSTGTLAGIYCANQARVYLNSVTLSATGNPAPFQPCGNGILCIDGGVVWPNNVVFDACSVAHVSTDRNSTVNVPQLGANIAIVGGAPNFILAIRSSIVGFQGANISISNNPTFSESFANIEQASQADFRDCQFVGAAHGKRYSLSLSALLNTGTADPNFLPGDIAGTQDPSSVYA